MSKQTHIFATRSDLQPGLKELESKMEMKYARCDLYYGPVYDQYLSLLTWEGLGKNKTGEHITGTRFLVTPRDCKINLEPLPQSGAQRLIAPDEAGHSRARVIGDNGEIPNQPISLDKYLTSLEGEPETQDREPQTQIRYDVSQKLNPDSITFLPGGIYKEEKILVCGHIGTVSNSAVSCSLYKAFVMTVTKGFRKIGSYRVGPEASRLMDHGYRMVTIGITSPPAYDLRRPD